MGRGDLTSGQWARLEPLLPQGIKPGRPQVWTRRQLIDGIRWRTRTGAPWRDVPERYGPWDRVYDLFRRWQRDGTWAGILDRLQAEGPHGPSWWRYGRKRGGQPLTAALDNEHDYYSRTAYLAREAERHRERAERETAE